MTASKYMYYITLNKKHINYNLSKPKILLTVCGINILLEMLTT